MIRRHGPALAALAAAATFVWLRDRSWMSASADALPLLAALPAAAWLGRPWRLVRQGPVPIGSLAAAAGVFMAGLATNFTLLLAAGWVLAALAWLKSRLLEADWPARRTLVAVLGLLAFPWLILDAAGLAWWFRLSAAVVAEATFAGTGLSVTREGTLLLVQGLPLGVEAACSGLQTLQAMLIAGSAAAWMQFGGRAAFWWSLPLIVAVAWLTNVVRVLLISALALGTSPEVASGPLHDVGGWAVVVAMFLVLRALFHRPAAVRRVLTHPRPA